MPEWIIQLIFAFIGGGIALIISFWTLGRDHRKRALAEFRAEFFDDIIALKDSDNDIHRYITKGLNNSYLRQIRAIEIVKPYLFRFQRNKIDKAYNEYRNPKISINKSEEIDFDSFSLYDWPENEFKKIFSLEITGKNLALENLDKIINAVKYEQSRT